MNSIQKAHKKILLLLSNTEWSRKAIHLGYPANTRKSIRLEKLGLTIKRGEHEFIFDWYEKCLDIAKIGLFEKRNSNIFATIQGITIQIQSAEDLYILHEIFYEGCYNFHLQEQVEVIDIGMNVGMASLYFASKPNVTSVHAFELVVQTYEQGLKNFALNKQELASKIRSHNFGLGKESTTLSIEYDYENKGRAGIFGTERIRDSLKSPELVDVEIRSVFEEISDVLNSDRCESVVIKMDAEGAEYDLIDSLLPILGNSRIKIMMIEWHFEGPDAISKILTAAGFTTFCFNPYEPNAGMIYATR